MKVKAAVFSAADKTFAVQEFPLPQIEPEGILVKVSMCTICGSDLHTQQGRREVPLSIILGHEVMGEIKEIGKGVDKDTIGNSLSVGDRITWTIMASCGRCYYCQIKRLPQKCLHVFKYGHQSCACPPHLNGGMAEYIYLRPGTGIFKIPEELSEEEVVPINCALATVVHGLNSIEIQLGETVVVQGAGMLGTYAVAVLREKGAGRIIIIGKDQYRLDIAKNFGADDLISINGKKQIEILSLVKEMTSGYGADVAIEVSGSPQVIAQGLEMLRIGGRYLLIGTVFPKATFELDGYLLTTKMITIKGIHNYSVSDLAESLHFLKRTHKRYPFADLVTHRFNLQEVKEAFLLASHRRSHRVAIVP